MGTARSRPGGLDGRSLRAHQWDVTRKRSIVMSLPLAVAVTPALAAEHGRRAAPRMEQRRTAPPAPPATSPAREVLQTLERLRLHPGQDALDVAETARKRPEKPAD
jgi:hypothetical protein